MKTPKTLLENSPKEFFNTIWHKAVVPSSPEAAMQAVALYLHDCLHQPLRSGDHMKKLPNFSMICALANGTPLEKRK